LVGLYRIVGWLKAKKQGERLHQFHKRIASLYEDGKLDKNDIKPLDKIKNDITDAYAKGKISDCIMIFSIRGFQIMRIMDKPSIHSHLCRRYQEIHLIEANHKLRR
jgi:hypothetical protein